MKTVKLLILLVLISFTVFFGCTSQEENINTPGNDTISTTKINKETPKDSITEKEAPKEIKQTTPKDYTAKYICPMHCSKSGSDKMGDCPECGMELIKNPTTKKIIQK